MCGRFVVAEPGTVLAAALNVDVVGENLPGPSFNVAPTSRVAVVLDSAKTEPPTRRLEAARWGLVPGWAKDVSIGARAFNARSEDAEHKPMFRAALARRRAVVPASGYYEWQAAGTHKVPHYIHPEGGSLLFAGLYEWWKDPARADDDPARWLLSFTVLTRAATGALADIHDRMPLFLDVEFADAWLDPTEENVGDVLDAAIDAAPQVADTLVEHVVSAAVGSVRNDSPDLIGPVR